MITDRTRKEMIRVGQPAVDLAVDTGPKWDHLTLAADFTVLGFAAPFVVVRRRADGVRGTLEFTDQPRVYFDFQPYTPDLLSRDDAVVQPLDHRGSWKRVYRPAEGHEVTELWDVPADRSQAPRMQVWCGCGWRWDGIGRSEVAPLRHCGAR